MTTNAGASDLAKNAIGFGSEVRKGDDEEAINRLFTPEFRNRLDAVISFKALNAETIGRVVDKFVLQLEEQLADRSVTIELDGRGAQMARREGLRPSLRRPPADPRHPGAHQEAAGGGAAVRPPRQGRHRPCHGATTTSSPSSSSSARPRRRRRRNRSSSSRARGQGRKPGYVVPRSSSEKPRSTLRTAASSPASRARMSLPARRPIS